MSTEAPRFIFTGENIHTTRALLRKNARIAVNEVGEAGLYERDSDSGIVDATAIDLVRAFGAERDSRPFQLASEVLTGLDTDYRSYMKAHRSGELAK